MKFQGEVIEGYRIVRKGKKQTEYYKGGTADFKVKWISDYSYELEIIVFDIPSHLEGDLVVNITSVRKKEYDCIIHSNEGPSPVTMFQIE